MHHYTHFIFDIDGTLSNTEETCVFSLQKTVREVLKKDLPMDILRSCFGIPSADVGIKLGVTDPKSFTDRWEVNFQSMMYLAHLFEGVTDMLQSVKESGKKMGIVTSRSIVEFSNDNVIKEIVPLFDHIICAEDSETHKPEPDPVLEYMKRSGATPDDCLYLGDTMHDYLCAHSAGCDFALADWNERGLQGIPAEYRFTCAEDVLKLL